MKNHNTFIVTLVILSIILSPSEITNIFALEDSSGANFLEKKLYSDPDFGYSFYYPADFILRESLVAGELSLSNYDPSIVPSHGFGDNQFKISTYIYEKPESLSLRDWFLNAPFDPDFPVKINSFTETVINGIRGIRTNTTGYFGITSESVYLPIDDNKILHISVLPATSFTIGIFDEILNSFNNSDGFTNSFQTSIWSVISPKLAHAGDLTLPFYLPPIINSYFDHNSPNYANDGITTVFDGRVGLSSNGICWSWPLGSPTYFAYNDNTGNCLYYNGHDGIDFDTGYGDPIIVVADGQVTFAGCSSPPICDQDLGKYVKIWHSGLGYSTIYGHLLDIATSTIYAGAPVTRGQLLGWSDHTGAASGDHLHFMVRNAQTGGLKADPYGWIPGPSAATTTDPCQQPSQPCVNLGYLWTTNPPSLSTTTPPIYVSGTISTNTTWTSGNVYVVQGSVTVNPGVTLTIEPGVIVKFNPDTSLIFDGTSTINALGTPLNKIYFTSLRDDSVGGDTNGDGTATTPAPGDYYGIYFNSGSSGALDYASFRYGGKYPSGAVSSFGGSVQIHETTFQYNRDAVVQRYGGDLVVDNSLFLNNNIGLVIDPNTTAPITLTNSRFGGNELYDAWLRSSLDFTNFGNTGIGSVRGFWMNPTGLATDQTLNPGIPFIVLGLINGQAGLYVPDGKTLVVNPGTVIKMRRSVLQVYGTLIAHGTPGQKIYFTSLYDDSLGGDSNGDGNASVPAPGDYYGIAIGGTGIADIDSVTAQFGGKYWCCGVPSNGVIRIYGGNVSLTNSRLNNNNNGIQQTAGTTTVSYSSIYNNISYGIYNSGTNAVSAQNNWWGTPSGPYHPTLNPSGAGNQISNNVNFNPWLAFDPDEPPPIELP